MQGANTDAADGLHTLQMATKMFLMMMIERRRNLKMIALMILFPQRAASCPCLCLCVYGMCVGLFLNVFVSVYVSKSVLVLCSVPVPGWPMSVSVSLCLWGSLFCVRVEHCSCVRACSTDRGTDYNLWDQVAEA